MAPRGEARWRAIAAALLFVFVLTIAAVHVAEGEAPLRTTLSVYAIGPHGWIIRLGFVAFGLAGWVTDYLLDAADLRGRIFLWLFGMAMLGVAAINTDAGDRPATLHGLEHSISAVIVFFSLPLAAWLCGWMSVPLRFTATLQAAAAIALLTGPPTLAGALELLVVALALVEFSLLLAWGGSAERAVASPASPRV